MLDIDNKTVAELVTENYKTADVFKKNGIDFCCGGKVTVKSICKQKKIGYAKLKSELEAIDVQCDSAHDFDSWNLEKLADYIIDKHHNYVTENNPIISQYVNKVVKVHAETNPELVQISYLFRILADELNRHMCKEENILFPYIKFLAQVELKKTQFVKPHFETIQNPIDMMEKEHDMVGNYSAKIAELSNNYSLPNDACNTYRVLYAKLKEFEDDLFQHIHLENNILFPKAIELEKKFLKQ